MAMVTMDNYEEYLLLYADGELDEVGITELLAFMEQHPELKAEMDMYAATKLVPDEAVVYNGKEQLMKKAPAGGGRTIGLRSWWVYGAAAACIAILVTIGINNSPEDNAPIAHTTTETKRTDTNVHEELHSTPKSPVAVETKQTPAAPVLVAKAKKEVQRRQPQHTPTPVIAKQEAPIKPAENPNTIPAQQPERPVVTPPRDQATIASAKGEEVTIPLPVQDEGEKEEEVKKRLLASLPVKENLQGLNELSRNVGERLEKIKDLPGKLRDTDVRFKIGKKELFVVRL